ncbi:hypothetical protein PB1_01915 [Bacillus methanolicus PB1]|uniref:Uncharacterized protein n=1 Tax=Bacillus methanolicus PB1 TaxID=997296 RepID=I3DW40_BACMT|nr:hypothetical protein PB1_12924 [Bacillus methanolicus PB1]EIJ81658.1 hypothetical protein PB1_01915 [Bacillus methanolicus PB1]
MLHKICPFSGKKNERKIEFVLSFTYFVEKGEKENE